MKTRWDIMYGRGFLVLSSLSVLFFLGCAGTRQPLSVPAPPKPETAEVVSTPQKTYPEMDPAAPAAPSPASSQPPPPEPEPQAAPKPRTATAQDPVATGDVLLNPSVPEDAKAIQSRLAELGFYKMAIDGIWERGSRAALRDFKEKNSLQNPEEWDPETQIALFQKEGFPLRTVDNSDPLASGAVFLNPSKPEDVQTIQGRLAELGFYSGAVDAIWGRDSQAALRAFKEKSGLKNPEQWDKETQILLFRDLGK